MSEEKVEIEIDLDNEIAVKLGKLTKKELTEKYIEAALGAHVAERRAKAAESEAQRLQTNLDKCEAYLEQSRSMIEAVMQRWYEYDT